MSNKTQTHKAPEIQRINEGRNPPPPPAQVKPAPTPAPPNVKKNK